MAEPIISYPGSKWRFYEWMVPYFPTDMKVFIEPFLGGGSVTLSVADDPRFTKLERMIAGDLAPEMWAFWTGVKENPDDVLDIATKWFTEACPHQPEIHATGLTASKVKEILDKSGSGVNLDDDPVTQHLELYNVAVEEAKKFWDWTQKVDTGTMSIPERAARILLVNKISFSGMGDSGSLSKDQFCNFHLGKLDRVHETSKLLQRVEIYNESFEKTMNYAHEDPENTFIFLDPPYYKQESSGLYGRNGDTHKGFPHQHFAEFTKAMPCKWFVTYDDSVYVRKMFKGKTALGGRSQIIPFIIPGGYTLAGKTSEDALAGEEVFILNYDIDDSSVDLNNV